MPHIPNLFREAPVAPLGVGSNSQVVDITDTTDLKTHIENLTKDLNDQCTPFSRDTLVVEVSGPDCPNLTFIDLPGFVSGENKMLIENMIDKYLEQERTTILTVDACENKTHHGTAYIADHPNKKIKDSLQRTICVRTKPDLMNQETEKRLVKEFEQNSASSNHIVNCSTEIRDDPNLYATEVRWFKKHRTFRNMHPGNYGIENLNGKLEVLIATRLKKLSRTSEKKSALDMKKARPTIIS